MASKRLLKYVVVTEKAQAKRIAKHLREQGCKVTYRKTKDPEHPYKFYGSCPKGVHRRYYSH